MELKELYNIFLKHPVVSTDTRNLPNGCIFFALKGPNFNANQFAEESINKGAAFAVIDEPEYQKGNPQLLLVDDVLTALQQLATYRRSKLNLNVLAIGGSNGKTTTKELIAAVLNTKLKTFATPGNLNNHIGVPLCLLQLNELHQWAVLELGSNHPGEMEPLLEMTQPNYGIVTNVGKDHLEGYGSLEGAARENSTVYFYLHKNGGTALVNEDDEHLVRMAARLTNKVSFGTTGPNALKTIPNETGYLSAETLSGKKVNTSLVGEYNLPNIAAALAIGKIAGIDEDLAISAIESYKPGNNRSQLIETSKNKVIADCYNANPSSMELAVKSLLKSGTQGKVLILGEMREMGAHAEIEHQNMLALVASYPKAVAYFVGDEFMAQSKNFPQFKYFKTREDLAAYLADSPIEGNQILLKASRGIALEKLIPLL